MQICIIFFSSDIWKEFRRSCSSIQKYHINIKILHFMNKFLLRYYDHSEGQC